MFFSILNENLTFSIIFSYLFILELFSRIILGKQTMLMRHFNSSSTREITMLKLLKLHECLQERLMIVEEIQIKMYS